MPEGLSPQEVGKEIAEHAEHGGRARTRHGAGSHGLDHRGRPALDRRSAGGLVRLRGGEVEHRVARRSGRGLGREDEGEPGEPQARSSFGTSTPRPSRRGSPPTPSSNQQAMALAEHRFRPAFRVAFDAWRATKPETNPNAPRGPTYMPQYRQPGLARRRRSTRRRTRPSPPARRRARRPTSTSARRSSSRACSSSSASARASRSRGGRYALVGLGARAAGLLRGPAHAAARSAHLTHTPAATVSESTATRAVEEFSPSVHS